MLADIGLEVSRQIPVDTLARLATGAYSLHGGVIRDTGGRIVSHLVTSGAASGLPSLVPGVGTISNVIANGQIWQLSKNVAQVQASINTLLNVSMAGTALSGLGLVTSLAGFTYLKKRFDQVDTKLAELARDVKDIKDWLASLQKSNLMFAIDCITHAETAKDESLRRDMLLQGKREFSTLMHQYKDQWVRCRTADEIQAVNDLYTLAMLGYATVCSDLGIGEDAARDIRGNCLDWSTQARAHIKTILQLDRPGRFLAPEYVEDLPTRELVALLDFANQTERGIEWVDDLRTNYKKHSSLFDSLPTSRRSGDDLSKRLAIAQSLRARADVLDANVSHYDFLQGKQISATTFQKQLEQARKESGAEAICVQSMTQLVV